MNEILHQGPAASNVVGFHEVVAGVGLKLLGGEETGGNGVGIIVGAGSQAVGGGFNVLVVSAGPSAVNGYGHYGMGGGLPQDCGALRCRARCELGAGGLQALFGYPGMFPGRPGRRTSAFLQQGDHTGDELAHQAAVIGQLVRLDEAVVELGAELLSHGVLVAQVVVAGRVGQAVSGGFQGAGVVGGPAPLLRHGGQGVGRGVPDVFVGQQRLFVREVPVGGVEICLGGLGDVVSSRLQ